MVECGWFRDVVVGVENLEGSCEDADDVGGGEERMDGEGFAVESCGEMWFEGSGMGLWRLRFVGLAMVLGSLDSCLWYCGPRAMGASALFSYRCLLVALLSVRSAGA